jgi:Golgi nucleoside diphosphatase
VSGPGKETRKQDSERSQDLGEGRICRIVDWLLLFAMATARVLLVLCAASFVYTGLCDDGFQYALLFDAGSTGTRLTISRWPLRQFSDSTLPPPFSVPVQIYSYSNRSTPGINVPAGVDALSGMLAIAQQQLSSEAARWKTFPVFLCATAGMRILSAPARAAIMQRVRGVLSASAFLFEDRWARVISGEEEGVFGWITVNYQLGLLSNATGVANVTVGALDFGGASTQITVAPVLGVDLLAGSYELVLSGGIDTQLYTHSFLYM